MGRVSLQPADDHVRIGDVERQAVDERLHRAVGDGVLTLGEYDERAQALWAARTRGELAVVVADLPGALPTPASALPAPATGRVHRTVAVMSEERLRGPVAPGESVAGYAVMGSAHLDLDRDDLPSTVSVRAVAVMGDVQVVVPRGADVRLTGASVMGDRGVDLPPALPGGPVVHLHAVAVMGSVSVRAPKPGEVSAADVTAADVTTADVTAAYTAAAYRSADDRSSRALAAAARSSRRWRPRRQRRTVVLVGIAAAIGLGALSHGGSGSGGSGDRVLTVRADQSVVDVPSGSGDVTVVVPDDVQVDTSQLRGGSGDVTCEAACAPRPAGARTVVLRGGGGSGDVDVETATQHD
ncbi:MAG: hypothetical protein JWN17_748 [Frankiales bacterium]|nr:hypothetical protein [Frankiales bacterium]